MDHFPGKVFLTFVILFCSVALCGAEDLKTWLDDPELWQKEDVQLAKKFEKTLAWRDGGHQALYCPAKNQKNFCFGEYPVYDLLLNFKENRLNSVSFAIFSRGDFKMAPAESTAPAESGRKKKKKTNSAKEARQTKNASKEQQKAMDKQFKTMIAAVRAENRVRFKCEAKQKQSRLASSRKTVLFWQNEQLDMHFVIGTGDGGTPEFLSISFAAPPPPVKKEPPSETALSPLPPMQEKKPAPSKNTKITKEELRARLHEENGEHTLDLPMVDQGSKGYCVPASVLRVLHYYGIPVGFHELARMLDATATGTAYCNAIKSLRKIDGRFGVHYLSLYEAEFLNEKLADDFILHYNQRAARADMPPIGNLTNPVLFYPVYHKMRANRGQTETFFRKVSNSIDSGIPLLWAVFCFDPKAMSLEKIVEAEKAAAEKAARASGSDKTGKDRKKRGGKVIHSVPPATGHMRVITGYRENPRGIIYSDSWGVGAEKKFMELDEAWTISVMLFVLLPNR